MTTATDSLTDDERFALGRFIDYCVIYRLDDSPDDTSNEGLVMFADRLTRCARVRRAVEAGTDPAGDLMPWRDEIEGWVPEVRASIAYEEQLIVNAQTGDPGWLIGTIEETVMACRDDMAAWERVLTGLTSLLERVLAVPTRGVDA